MNVRAWLIIFVGFLVAVVVVLILSSQLTKQKTRADNAESLAKQRQETINDMQTRQRDVAALDTKYTKELADAKAKLDALQQCVSSGKCGLRLNATCSKGSSTKAGSMGDDATARLNDSAQRDYFTLRERIAIITGQVSYLQQYIREQCLQ